MHLQHLRERSTLLESLLLFVEQTPLDSASIKRIFAISKKHFFLLNPSTSYLVDSGVAAKLSELAAVLLQLVLLKTITRMSNDLGLVLTKNKNSYLRCKQSKILD